MSEIVRHLQMWDCARGMIVAKQPRIASMRPLFYTYFLFYFIFCLTLQSQIYFHITFQLQCLKKLL